MKKPIHQSQGRTHLDTHSTQEKFKKQSFHLFHITNQCFDSLFATVNI